MKTPNTSAAVAMPEPPKLGAPQAFADDVQEFVSQHGLETPLRRALTIASTHFHLESAPTVRTVEDAESGENWVEISIRVHGDVASVRAAHRQYTQMWLNLVPPEHTLKIRLAIRIA